MNRVAMELLAVATLLTALCGCSDDEESVYVDPNQLQLRCEGLTDAACDGAEPTAVASELADHHVFAVGAEALFSNIASLSQNVFSGHTASKPGIGTAVTQGGQYTHLEVREVETLLLTHNSGDFVFDRVIGEDPIALRVPRDHFRAVLVDDQDNVLGGAVDVRWKSDNPAVIDIVAGADSTVCEVEIGEEGTAKISVDVNEWHHEIDIDVAFN